MHPLFALGFRPFFLGAAAFAVLSMLAWALVYAGAWNPGLGVVAASAWHAHEMVYGYAMAVVAGFLLTATRNWTGLPTPGGAPLGGMLALWLLARLAMLAGERGLPLAAAADLAFSAWLLVAVAVPNLRAKQWRQMAVLSKLLLLGAGNAAFYAGAAGLLDDGVQWGLYGGFYLLIALILTMGRRLVPFFTERGVSPPVVLRNVFALDMASLGLLLAFWVAEVFLRAGGLAAACAAGVFAVNAVRLVLWYTPGILARPLLWSLHAALALIALGFGLRALAAVLPLSPFLGLHTMAIGGIGLVTLSMMARVSLGHTGRNVHAPPRIVRVPLWLLLASVLLRVGGPLLAPTHYAGWVLASQVAWIAAFTVFTVAWAPVLARPRVDGQPG